MLFTGLKWHLKKVEKFQVIFQVILYKLFKNLQNLWELSVFYIYIPVFHTHNSLFIIGGFGEERKGAGGGMGSTMYTIKDEKTEPFTIRLTDIKNNTHLLIKSLWPAHTPMKTRIPQPPTPLHPTCRDNMQLFC